MLHCSPDPHSYVQGLCKYQHLWAPLAPSQISSLFLCFLVFFLFLPLPVLLLCSFISITYCLMYNLSPVRLKQNYPSYRFTYSTFCLPQLEHLELQEGRKFVLWIAIHLVSRIVSVTLRVLKISEEPFCASKSPPSFKSLPHWQTGSMVGYFMESPLPMVWMLPFPLTLWLTEWLSFSHGLETERRKILSAKWLFQNRHLLYCLWIKNLVVIDWLLYKR